MCNRDKHIGFYGFKSCCLRKISAKYLSMVSQEAILCLVKPQ